jgi:predicted amidohydrolase YtcJ
MLSGTAEEKPLTMAEDSTTEAVSPAPADLILTGGRVWTGPGCPAGGGPTAVAIAGGRVLAVGEDGELRGLAGPRTRVVDAGGRRIVPGLVDSHIHAIRAGLTYLDELDWTEVYSVADALTTVRAAAAARPAGTWITALGGFHPTQFTERRMPDRAELDAAAPGHPVFVHPLYGHDDFGVLSSAALAELGWTGACPDPDGGVLHRDVGGAPDGRLAGLAAYQKVYQVALRPSPGQAEASTRAFFARLAALGLTGVVDAGGMGMRPDKYRAIRSVWAAGDLPIRVRMNLGATTRGRELAEIAAWQEFLGPGFGDDLLAVLGLGEVIHLGCHDWEGMVPFDIGPGPYKELVGLLGDAAANRWPVTVHAILEDSISRILDAIEEVSAATPVGGLRWSLCHAECISPADLQRVRRLGLGLAVQSRLGHKAGVCAAQWGEDAVRNGPPLGEIARLGIPFGAGTDSTRGASYNPWRALWWFVTGRSQDGGPRRAPGHRLDRATALDAYTRGSTWFSFEDHRRGQLRPGADADLAILSADYFGVEEDEIPFLTADLTVVAGRIVHASDAFSPISAERHSSRPAPLPAGSGGA